MKKKNNKNAMIFYEMGGLSVILLILLWVLVDLSNIITSIVIAIIIIIVAVISLVFGFKAIKESKKDKKKLNKLYLGIMLEFIIIIFTIFNTFILVVSSNVATKGEKLCTENSVKSCVDNNDGTATCLYMGYHKITCKTADLKDNQYKK